MRGLRVPVALIAALVVQTTLGRVFGPRLVVDLVLVVVVYLALVFGPMTGVMAGTVGGLVQDALSSGILGIGGLAKTVVGFLAGRFGTQFIVTATIPRFFVFAAATVVHALIFMGLYGVLGLRSFPNPLLTVASQAVGNGLVGIVGFQLVEWVPRLVEQRRVTRSMRVKR